MRLILVLVLGYLLGSLPLALWMGKFTRGIDIREYGSGNAGATNALRVLGLKAGLLVLALDMAKGLAAVLVISRVAPPLSVDDPSLARVLTGGCAILGHIFPITTGFRGGKGVGTGAGVMFALTPVVTLCVLMLWVGIVAATRYVSLASMIAAVFVPALLVFGKLFLGNEPGRALISFSMLLAAAVLLSHHANIRRLLAGRENKFTLSMARPRKRSS
jgi:glycerol-3-phosphate acyltransferase PlsY